MKCPYCGNEKHGVRDTETKPTSIARIRKCAQCKQPFPTSEVVVKIKKPKGN